MTFATLTDYEAFVPGASEDELLVAEAELPAACAEITAELCQTLTLVEDDEVVLDGTGKQTLLLPELPVLEVTSVVLDAGEDTEEEITDYVVGYGGILYRRCGWTHGYGNYTVTYTHGYETVPADIIKTAVLIARSHVQTEDAGMKGEVIQGYSYTRGTLSAQDFRHVLDLHRVRRIPAA